jgi:membrane-associated phospholipid phosphatase
MRSVSGSGSAVFIGSAVGSAVAFAVVYLFFVTTTSGQLLDERAFEGARLGQRSLAPVTLSLLDSLPILGVAIALLVAVVVTAIRRNWLVLAVAIPAAVAANLLTQFLKNMVLDRPDLNVAGYAFNSLPSGHTTVAASAAMVVFLVSSPRMRPLAAAIGALFAIVVGSSTLANQWHRPSDVIAALLVVAFCGCLAGLVLARFRSAPAERADSGWNRVLLWTALPCAALAALALAVSAIRPASGLASLPLAYIGGVAGIAASVLLLAAAANRAFRSVR